MRRLSSPAQRQRAGLTLIEVIVVVLLSLFLIGLALCFIPSNHGRGASRRSQCKNNLKQLALAVHNYHETYACFPPGQTHDNFASSSPNASRYWSWTALSLPYLDQAPMYNAINFQHDAWPASTANQPFTATNLMVLECPASEIHYTSSKSGFTNYLGVSGDGAIPGGQDCAKQTLSPSNNGIFYRNSDTKVDDILDGTSSTLLFGERGLTDPQWGWWTGPGAAGWCPGGYGDVVLSSHSFDGIGGLRPSGWSDPNPSRHWWSHHLGGAHFSLADGSVRFVSSAIDHNTLRALSTRAGGEPIGDSSW